MPVHTDDKKMDKPKGGNKMRKMTEKEKEVFAKVAEGMNKSEKAKLRMKVMRSSSPVETPAKMKKMM